LPSPISTSRAPSTARSFSASDAAVRVGLGQDDHELLADVAADDVHRTDVVAEPSGHGIEHLVAGDVAVGVVEPLEVVEVDQDDRELPVVASGPLQLLLEACQHGLAIEDLGELVDGRQRPGLGDSLLEPFEGIAQPPIADTDPSSLERGRVVGEAGRQADDPTGLAAADEHLVAGGADEGRDEQRGHEDDRGPRASGRSVTR
jgi:hypothetical protein